jgi:hypothetical protein
MMLALPLQAFASAAMIGCSMMQHAAMPSLASDTEMSGCHESAPQPDSSTSQHSCAHCAACYLTSIPLLPTVSPLSALPTVSAMIPHATTSFSGFIPEGPKRPPRA